MRLAWEDRVFTVFIYTALTLLGFLTFYPFWNAAVVSFNEGTDTSLGNITFWPRVFTLENYAVVLKDIRILKGFVVSIARTLVGTFLTISITALFAYGMSRKELIGRNYYMTFAILTLYFSGGLIPTYLLIRNLGMFDSFWVFVIPTMVNVWSMIIFRTFFKEIPPGLEDAARIDGCGYWSTFIRVVVPLSGPVIATLSLFAAIVHWNDWFVASIYINNKDLLPVQTLLKQTLESNIASELNSADSASTSFIMRSQTYTTKSLTMATMMVTTLPIVLVYPFLQRYFVKGVLVGSLKE
ncbi:putative aldouronate transport system permease protein [Paenibacillus sp. UNCCL117]|uniref:carbohydrate ABC transporter permease n=1 Tax=unclassified Paenibacillus TaxID=185978 RepID=UPI00088E8434|nr:MULTISPECIES: carbohydrate ABC transporter permease [unclassified Paenibacillus]SDD18160.1 carbohydrate ABC transporter membrane protein 2, CUT1 family [Paenibacillus sp. cl123]SFW35155.1 putative aldouronate transport system permease protein [Paenibacillus sp. UNCCL117]